jgi:hypothetical protein
MHDYKGFYTCAALQTCKGYNCVDKKENPRLTAESLDLLISIHRK